jgi:hypothetical protein
MVEGGFFDGLVWGGDGDAGDACQGKQCLLMLYCLEMDPSLGHTDDSTYVYLSIIMW